MSIPRTLTMSAQQRGFAPEIAPAGVDKMQLIVDNNLPDPDRVFQLILSAHHNLSREESEKLNAKLVLLLTNHIGNDDILAQAIDVASREA